MPFLDPKNDLVFKRVFGNEHRKEILFEEEFELLELFLSPDKSSHTLCKP